MKCDQLPVRLRQAFQLQEMHAEVSDSGSTVTH
jgi:hypothetical protein